MCREALAVYDGPILMRHVLASKLGRVFFQRSVHGQTISTIYRPGVPSSSVVSTGRFARSGSAGGGHLHREPPFARFFRGWERSGDWRRQLPWGARGTSRLQRAFSRAIATWGPFRTHGMRARIGWSALFVTRRSPAFIWCGSVAG